MQELSFKEEIKWLEEKIREKENLRKITEHDSWKDLLEELHSFRVTAFYGAVQEGDTTDAKAYARALDNLICLLAELEDDTELTDYKDRRDSLKNEIKKLDHHQRDVHSGSAAI